MKFTEIRPYVKALHGFTFYHEKIPHRLWGSINMDCFWSEILLLQMLLETDHRWHGVGNQLVYLLWPELASINRLSCGSIFIINTKSNNPLFHLRKLILSSIPCMKATAQSYPEPKECLLEGGKLEKKFTNVPKKCEHTESKS